VEKKNQKPDGSGAPDHVQVALESIQALTDSKANVVDIGVDADLSTILGAFQHIVATDSLHELANIAGLQGHMKWTKRQCGGTTATSQFKPMVSKSISGSLKKLVSWSINIPAISKEQSALTDAVYAPQAWALTEEFSNVGVTPYGISEMRLLLDGSYCIAGVKIDKIDGADISEKIQNCLTKAGMQAFMTSSKDPTKGFACLHDEAGAILHVPPEHIIMTTGSFDAVRRACVGVGLALRHQGNC
jgi:hypothetical protein